MTIAFRASASCTVPSDAPILYDSFSDIARPPRGDTALPESQTTMSTLTLSLPVPRQLALHTSRLLERWAMRPDVTAQERREAVAYEQAVAAGERTT